MMDVKVLVTDKNGVPRDWVNFREACCYYAKGKVVWDVGESVYTFLGGKNAHGIQSVIHIAQVIGSSGPLVGEKWLSTTSKALERNLMYARDRHTCAYCGRYFHNTLKLTIDHIFPQSRGGKTSWLNCVTACLPCNHRKANKTPDECNMPLRFKPFHPNRAEKFVLKNRKILPNQMEFLRKNIRSDSLVLDENWAAIKLAS